METLDINVNSHSLSEKMKSYLLETTKWAKFLAIIGFVVIGIMTLVGVFMLFGASFLSSAMSVATAGASMATVGILYIIMTLLYFFPTLYLYQFATKTKASILSSSNEDLEVGFEKLKSLFKFMGIFTVVVLAIYALIFIFGILAALA